MFVKYITYCGKYVTRVQCFRNNVPTSSYSEKEYGFEKNRYVSAYKYFSGTSNCFYLSSKAIKDLFERWFPDLSETEFYNIFPKKEAVNIITTITGSDDVVYIYTVRNIPIAFEHIGILFPTIFLLWRYPNLVPTLTTYPYVVKFIYGGADLKIEGVLHPPGGYKDFKEGVAACVNHTNNSAPVAVGITTASSIQVKSSSGSGKCLKVLHFYGDKLCQLNKVEYSIPSLGKLPEFLKKPTKEEFPPLEKLQLGDAGSVNISESKPEDDGNAPSTSSSTSVDTVMPEDMNYLLHHKMLTVLKYTKSYKLPILSSTFYKLMKDACSEGENLDVKKSTYKKIGKFLAEMQKVKVFLVYYHFILYWFF